MQVTVTGGAGFIGHHLVRELLGRGYEVVVLDNLRRGSFERPAMDAATCLQGDIRDLDDCRKALAGSDAVVHLAAQSNVMGSQHDPSYTYETNVTGTWNIARAASECGLRQFVFASSREVYGEAAVLPVREDAPLAPHNLYGASKVAGEMLLQSLPWPTPEVAILRLGNVIGPGDAGRVTPLWLEAARERRPLILFGGEQILDFVPVSLVCNAFLRVLDSGAAIKPVNVASGRATTLRELSSRIRALYPQHAPAVDVRPARAVEVTRFVADVNRMREVLGLEPPADPLSILAEMRDVTP